MADARRLPGCRQIAARCLEEMQDRAVLERRRVRHIHHHLRAGQCFGQSFPRQRIDPCLRRRGEHVMALCGKPRHNLLADKPGTADDNDFHAALLDEGGTNPHPC
ncbi:hypothetical protein D3C72_1753750 [compost metagenome]